MIKMDIHLRAQNLFSIRDQMNKRIDPLSEAVTGKDIQALILKPLINLVPYIGPTLNECFFEIPNRIQQERLKKTVEMLTLRVDRIDSKKIDKGYLQSEDFFDFSKDVFEKSLKIKIENKRRTLVNVYIDSILQKADFEESRLKLFLDFIVQLSPFQMSLLKFIGNRKKELLEIGSYNKFFDLCQKITNGKIDQYEFKYYSLDMENKGLISCGSGLSDYNSQGALLALSSYKPPSVMITDFGYQFLAYLDEDEKNKL